MSKLNVQNEELIVINQNLTVQKEFYDSVHYMMLDGSKRCAEAVPYSVKKIIDASLWKCFDDREKREIGMCVVHMVENGNLPFDKSPGKHEYPKLYTIRQ